MSFTEFYCNPSGDNLNAGSTTGTSAAQTYAGGTWVSGTGVFTVASGNPSSDGVTVGDFASVYTTAGATVAQFVGRVTARDATTITLSLTAISGTAASPSATANACTCKVGGAWKGPNGTQGFPFNFVAGTLTNSGGDTTRVNFKNSASYLPTSAMTNATTGPVVWQGYSSSVGDGGRATIDGSTNAIALFSTSGGGHEFADFIFTNNAASGTNTMVSSSGNGACFRRCVFHDCRGNGLNISAGSVVECEFYACNTSNSTGTGGLSVNNGVEALRCIFHDNTGSNNSGALTGSFQNWAYFTECIFDTNGKNGLLINGNAYTKVSKCDFYNNGSPGIDINNSSGLGAANANVTIESCNFIKNGTYGIIGNGAGGRIGSVINCGFGAGTAANSSGTTSSLKGIIETGSVTYGSNLLPWVDAPNGDFRINLAAAKGAGRGTFTQTASSYAGAVGYPDIGSNQHQDAGGSTVIIVEED